MSPPNNRSAGAVPSPADTNAFQLLSSVTVYSYAVDRDLRVTHADGPLSTLTCVAGGMDDATVGTSLRDVLPEPERGRWERFVNSVLESEGADVFPAPTDLCPHPRRLLARPIRDADGEATGVFFVCMEMSEEGQAAHAEVGQKVLEEGRLDLARQFAVTLNHEINNPLFVVSATLEDVLAEPLDPALQRRLQTALDSVWRVAEAVKLLHEIRQIVSTTYIPGYTMIDLEASSRHPGPDPTLNPSPS